MYVIVYVWVCVCRKRGEERRQKRGKQKVSRKWKQVKGMEIRRER